MDIRAGIKRQPDVIYPILVNGMFDADALYQAGCANKRSGEKRLSREFLV